MVEEVEEIGAHQTVAAGEDQRRPGAFGTGELLDQGNSLAGVEFRGVTCQSRAGSAVAAREEAGLGGLPEDEEGPLVEPS